MIKHTDHFHGSDLEKIEKVYGIRKEDITSFSSNVNPLGISPLLRACLIDHIDAITSYPDREYTALRRQIGSYAGASMEKILVGNGSTELISLFIQIKHPRNALILGPTYSEYEREITLGGGSCAYFPLQEEQDFLLDTEALLTRLTDGADLLVICNPNNPTSTAVGREDMRRILSVCREHGIFVIVDETYVEFAPDMDAIDSVPLTDEFENLVVLRGVSKFFAAPGLRLGYAITGNTDLLEEISRFKNPWTINSLAAAAGELMFSDSAYIQQTRSLISGERDRIVRELSSWDSVKIYPSQANFLLVRIKKEGVTADDLFEHAIRKGLMIRNCSTFPFLDNSYFRFCFMLPEKNTELLNCLRELL